VCSLQLMSHNWQDIRQRLTPELTASFKLLAQFLPMDEEVLGQEEITSITEEIDGWQKGVEESDLPEEVKEFLLIQVALARRAVLEYSLRGSAAFDAVAVEASMSWANMVSEVERYSNDERFRGVKGLWQKIEKVCKRTILLSAAVAAFLAPVGKALDIWQDLPPRLTPPTEPRQLKPGPPPPADPTEPPSPGIPPQRAV